MSTYIAKFAFLAVIVATLAAGVSVGLTVYLLSNASTCRKPLYCMGFGALAAVISQPVAAALAVILLKLADSYWVDVQTVWMFRRLLVGSAIVSFPYVEIGGAVAA